MERDGELDQFQLLEERVDSLIQFIEAFKKEKESSIEKIRNQEEKKADLTGDIEILKGARDRAKQMISSLLAKIEQLEL
jgi:chromosome segregation ATPase